MKAKVPFSLSFPDGKKFAFTIFDDCDNSTIENTLPFYELLEGLGMRTTKTVWCFNSDKVHPNWRGSITIEEPEYREFVKELQTRGFEIAFHGASMMSSPRERTKYALEVFRETFGQYPRSYANHGSNRENIYWFANRLRSPALKLLYTRLVMRNRDYSEGHVADSPYFWGDLCKKFITYVRGFTFPTDNLFSVHRNILYHDPAAEFVNYWFSASQAPSVKVFNELFQPTRRQSLVRDGGVCIVGTHVAAGFVKNGEVNPDARRVLEKLAESDGWFVPVSTLLDYLRLHGFGGPIPSNERRLVEFRWLLSAMGRGHVMRRLLRR